MLSRLAKQVSALFKTSRNSKNFGSRKTASRREGIMSPHSASVTWPCSASYSIAIFVKKYRVYGKRYESRDRVVKLHARNCPPKAVLTRATRRWLISGRRRGGL